MQFSKWRLVWLIGCGFAVALIVVLSSRSFYTASTVSAPLGRSRAFKLISQRGFLGILAFDPDAGAPTNESWGLHSFDPKKVGEPNWDFAIRADSDRYFQAMVPWWFVLLAGLSTVVVTVRTKLRFSLRSLIVVTTCAAVGMGVLACVMK